MNLFNILDTASNFCDSASLKRVFSFAGQIFNILKIVIPIIIIILGSIDFVKAIIAGNNDAMKSSEKKFIKRLILGVAVFFVFPIVTFVMNLLNQSNENQCMLCFTKPDALTCKTDSNTSNSSNLTINPNYKEESTSKTSSK